MQPFWEAGFTDVELVIGGESQGRFLTEAAGPQLEKLRKALGILLVVVGGWQLILYTLTPRIGYRIPLSERVDLTPRAGRSVAIHQGDLLQAGQLLGELRLRP